MNTIAAVPKKERSYGIDALRLATGLFIIAAHGGRFEPFPVIVHDAVSILSKWSVPFFFMVLGFFMGRNPDRNRAVQPMMRIAVMFALASILMIPLDLAQDGYITLRLVPKTFLLNGTHFHLWFLSSLVMGLLVIRITDEYEIKWLLPVCAIVALVGSIWLGSYERNESSDFGRHLSSIPYLWFGMLLSKRTFSLRTSVALIVIGLAIEIVEAMFINARGKELWLCPTLIGAAPLTLGIFGVGRSLPNSPWIRSVGKLGERFAGCIYITHVYFIWIVGNLAATMGIEDSVVFCALIVPIIFSLNLLTLWLIDRVAPVCVDVMLADKAAIQRVGQAISSLPRAIGQSIGIVPTRS